MSCFLGYLLGVATKSPSSVLEGSDAFASAPSSSSPRAPASACRTDPVEASGSMVVGFLVELTGKPKKKSRHFSGLPDF